MASPSSVAVILNPRAAGGAFDERRIEGLREIAGSRAVLFVADERGLVDAIAEGVRERGAETVAVIGGDGSIGVTLTALHKAYGAAPLPRIALLRGGTLNTVANSIGVRRGSPEDLLRRLLAVPSTPLTERNTLIVGERVGFLFTGAAMVGFLQVLYDSSRTDRGRYGALKLLARGSFQAFAGGALAARIENALTATLRIDGEEQPLRRYCVLGASTVEQVGLGFRAFPRAAEGRDQFQVFAFHGTLQALALQLPRIRRGVRVQSGLADDPLARRLVIEAPGEPIPYAIDGDILEARSRLAVDIGPRVLVHLP
jgi:diacylglycerol kinase family enzyme